MRALKICTHGFFILYTPTRAINMTRTTTHSRERESEHEAPSTDCVDAYRGGQLSTAIHMTTSIGRWQVSRGSISQQVSQGKYLVLSRRFFWKCLVMSLHTFDLECGFNMKGCHLIMQWAYLTIWTEYLETIGLGVAVS